MIASSLEKMDKNYLSEIKKLPLLNSIFNNKILERNLNFEKYMTDYNNWKISTLEDVEKFNEYSNIDEAYLSCGVCNQRITRIINIRELVNNCRKVSSGEFKTMDFDQNDAFCMKLYKIFSGVQVAFKGCRNNHILGFTPQNENNEFENVVFLANFSQVKIIYSNNYSEVF